MKFILSNKGRTLVRIQDGNVVTETALDDQLIEFGTAIEDGDLIRALSYLERLDSMGKSDSAGSKGLWATLARIGLDRNELRIAARAYAALGDISKVRFLMETLRTAEEVAKTISKYSSSKVLIISFCNGISGPCDSFCLMNFHSRWSTLYSFFIL